MHTITIAGVDHRVCDLKTEFTVRQTRKVFAILKQITGITDVFSFIAKNGIPWESIPDLVARIEEALGEGTVLELFCVFFIPVGEQYDEETSIAQGHHAGCAYWTIDRGNKKFFSFQDHCRRKFQWFFGNNVTTCSPELIADMAACGKEYGVDYAQDEVPPYPLFGLVYSLTGGNIALEDTALDKSIYTAYAYANIKAYLDSLNLDSQD